MMPRAIADWLVMTTVAKPARFSRRKASAVHGNTREQLEPIEIAALLDERAVAIEEDSRSAHGSRGRSCSSVAGPVGPAISSRTLVNTRSGDSPFMQR